MKKFMLVALFLLGLAQAAQAQMQIFACEPEWGALAQALGGDDVEVFTATVAQQDPHHIQARPSLIAKIRRTQLLVCTGAELEIGWLPVLLQRGANSALQPGQPGNFEAANYVRMRDVPQRLDRAEGDVHAQGNPHIQTDPRNILLVAQALATRMGQIDAAHKAGYDQRLADFSTRWQAAIARWELQAAPLRGANVVLHHAGWPYLVDWLGLNVVATLEAKPGVPLSAADLSALLALLKQTPAKICLYAAYQDPKADLWLQQHAQVKAVELPFTVGGTDGASDLFGLFDDTLARLLKGVQS